MSDKTTGVELPIIGQMRADTAAVVLMLAGGFCFTSMSAIVHALGAKMDWYVLVVIRAFFSMAFAFVSLAHSGKLRGLKTPGVLWLRSLFGSVAMLTTFYALTRLPISDATVVIETRPVWVALLAVYFLREKTGGNIWLAIAVGIVGVALVENPHFTERDYTVGFALVAAVTGGVVMICLRKLAHLDPRVIILHFSSTAIIVVLIMVAVTDMSIDQERVTGALKEPFTLLLLVGIGFFGTAGQFAMTKAFALGAAPRVAAVGLVKVGIAVFYDVVFWSRVFTLPTIGGIALILGSLGLIFYKRD